MLKKVKIDLLVVPLPVESHLIDNPIIVIKFEIESIFKCLSTQESMQNHYLVTIRALTCLNVDSV